MSNNLKYAPGKPGFGSKGDKGEDGQQGLSIYFTDYDPVSDVNVINLKIENNQSLWTTSTSSLPSGRTYMTGDLFFDNDGKCYEIDASENNFTYRFAELTMGGFFSPLGVTTRNSFERYFNSNTSPKYIIDNIYTTGGAIDYSAVPSQIYSVKGYNFARIEYSNVEIGDYNPFTVYSSGTSDKQSIAIVRNYNTNTFRIGNLDNAGNLRDVDLIFDVSSLRQKKQAENSFTVNTPEGTILTNYEINANSLFDSNFNSNPSDFYGVYHSNLNDASIYWTLDSFTNDSDVKGSLYFFSTETPFNGTTYPNDASSLQPLIFHNVDSSGEITISELDNRRSFSFFMKLTKNGWSRNSDTQYVYGGTFAVSPSTYQLDASGAYTADASLTFDVDANTTWTAALQTNPSTFLINLAYAYTGDSDGSIWVETEENTGADKTGIIRVTTSSGSTTDISIWHKGPITLVKVSEESYSETDNTGGLTIDHEQIWNINFEGLPDNTSVDISVGCYGYIENFNDSKAVQYDDVFQIISATKPEETYNKTGSTTTQDVEEEYSYAELSMDDVSTADNLQLKLDSWAYAAAGDTGYQFTHRIQLTQILITYRTGDLIEIDDDINILSFILDDEITQ